MTIDYKDGNGNIRKAVGTHTGDTGDPDISLESLYAQLLLVKAKTDNLDVALSGVKTGTDKIISAPATAANQATGNTSLSNIEGYVDGIETAIASTNTKLDTVHADLGALLPTGTPITDESLESGGAGALGWLSSLRKKIADLVGSLTEAAPASDTASSGLNGRLQRIAQRLTTLIAGIPLLAGEAHVGEIGGNLVSVSTEFTRPANTTAYAANDVVSDSTSATTMQALASAARVSGGSGYIVGIKVSTDKKSITPRIRIHFFGTNGATIAADNEVYKEVYADGSKRLFYYDMPAMTTAADTTNSDMSRSVDASMRIPYICAATSLYYVLETLDAFTPASGEKITVTTFLDRN